mgnify:CR=1 FL=1
MTFHEYKDVEVSNIATLNVLEEALESLGGINNVELVVSGTVKEESEQSEEVSI